MANANDSTLEPWERVRNALAEIGEDAWAIRPPDGGENAQFSISRASYLSRFTDHARDVVWRAREAAAVSRPCCKWCWDVTDAMDKAGLEISDITVRQVQCEAHLRFEADCGVRADSDPTAG